MKSKYSSSWAWPGGASTSFSLNTKERLHAPPLQTAAQLLQPILPSLPDKKFCLRNYMRNITPCRKFKYETKEREEIPLPKQYHSCFGGLPCDLVSFGYFTGF